MEEKVIHNDGKLRLKLFGEFTLLKPDDSEVLIKGPRKKAFIALLALSPKRDGLSRDNIIKKLWSKRSLEQSRASLRTLLNELGKTCKEIGVEFILKNQEKNSISINREVVSIDVDEFDELSKSHTDALRYETLRVYGDDLYEYCNLNDDVYQDWLEAERVARRDVFRDTLLDLQAHFLENSEHNKVIQIANRLIHLEKTEEKAHQALMRTFAAQGNKSALTKQYQNCLDASMELLNEPPSFETTALFNQLKAVDENQRASAVDPMSPDKSAENEDRRLKVGIPFFAGPDETQREMDKVTTDVINALIRFKWMRVVPRGTMREFRDQQVPAAEIGQRLGIEYILDGECFPGDDCPRLDVELVEVNSDDPLWGQSYDMQIPYNAKVSETLVGNIVNEIENRLREKEISRVLGNKEHNPSAYDCAWHAIHNIYRMTEDSFAEAQRLFEYAEKQSYQYAPIFSWWALWHIFNIGQGWSDNPKADAEHAFELAKKAYEMDKFDALALAIMGHCRSFLDHSFDEALDNFEESLSKNVNSAFAWTLSAATYTYIGNHEEALRRLEKVDQLCPIEPHFDFLLFTAKTITYLCKQDYEEAARWGRKSFSKNRNFSNGIKPLIAAMGHLGKEAQAGEYMRRLFVLEPNFSIEGFLKTYPFKKDGDRDHYAEGLRKAGVPEHPGSLSLETA